MARHEILSDREIAFLRELDHRGVKFLIVGLAAATLQGAPVVTQDVDLWFRDLGDPRIRQALRKFGGTYVPPLRLNPPMMAGKGLELFDIVMTMHGLGTFDEEWAGALEIRIGRFRAHVLPLDRIIRSKSVLRRPKDKRVLPVLRDVWKTLQARRRGRGQSVVNRGQKGKVGESASRRV
ncbi:MAG: hypothetical protein V1809_12465 [Planctomycetota bacterium]